MTVRLRAHHLLCVLTYVGRGYTPAFTANMDRVAERLSSGREDVTLIEGPDDLCAPLLGTPDEHCRKPGAFARDDAAAADLSALLGLPLTPGTTLPSAALPGLRAAFATRTIRTACATCPWEALCDGVAAGGFKETRLRGASA